MMPEKWLQRVLVLLIGFLPCILGAFIGVDIGTDLSKMPPASEVVAILKANQITHVRLYDADAHMLNALSNTSIEVMVGVTNEEVLGIGRSPSIAAAWVNKNVAAYVPRANITAIAVGSEVLTTIPHAAPVLAPAMNNLHKALVASNLNFRVKVSTPHSMDIITKPFPPSTAIFNSSWNSTMFQVLQFLKNTNSSFMLNAYPYYGYTKGDGIFPLEYALFQPLSSVKQIVDPNTLYHYDSMFDAMVDAAYYSIDAFNFSGISVVVTETGWPWNGGANEHDATMKNAETYNNNLVKRVLNDSGPPSQRTMPINTYIYELFNEDERRGPISERNWGLFSTNGSFVYPMSLNASSQRSGNSSGLFCIAKSGADGDKLRKGLNWACGDGHANCTAIQEGHPCYFPDTVENHASYAYNDYYQRMRSAGGTCDFDGTATTTSADPSYGSCAFSGSANSSTGRGFSPTASGPVSPLVGGSSRMIYPEIVVVAVVAIFLHWFWL
ncbi:Glucan endo-1 3-beta-glucosidase 4 [Bienertia sinuspersici]